MTTHEFAQIEATYENVTATCPRCSTRNVYNRASDIGHFRPLASHHVRCQHRPCGAELVIAGDTIHPAHEMLLLDSWGFLEEKRYMQAVLSATTAYEQFFLYYLQVELVLRPERRDRSFSGDRIQWINAQALALENRLERHTFQPLRRGFLRHATTGRRIGTMAAAQDHIANLPAKPPGVQRTDVLAVADENLRTLLLRVYDTTIAQLRNKVVHKNAYRPTIEEARAAVDDAHRTLFSLTARFRLKNIDLQLNEQLGEDE